MNVLSQPIEVRPLAVWVKPMLFGIVMLAILGVTIPNDAALPMWLRVLVPIGCAIGAVLELWLWRAARQQRLTVDATGIERVGIFSSRKLAWSDVTRYRYLSVEQPAVAHGRGGAGLLGLVTGALTEAKAQRRQQANDYFGLGYIELYSNGSNKPMRVGKHPFLGPQNGYVDLTDVIGVILDELHERAATSTSFAPFELEGSDLHNGDTAMPVADIDRVIVGNGTISIGDWEPMPMKTVDNSVLLLEQLAARGVAIEVAPEVYLPPSSLRVLAAS